MGGYAAYIWPAYGLTALVLLALLITAVSALRRVQERLKAHEGEIRPRAAGRHERRAT